MNQLNIKYGAPKVKRITGSIIGLYLLIFCLYFTITQLLASVADALFYTSLIGAILALVLTLSQTAFFRKSFLSIDSEFIDINMPNQKKINVEWVNVSKINIGVSYIVFFLNGGQKQQKLDLSALKYTDVGVVKAKIIELCEFKNISYTND